jgi:hypothetical protein
MIKNKNSHQILNEIHARIHESLLGAEEDFENQLLSDLEQYYHLKPDDLDSASEVIVGIKKLFALDIPNNQIVVLLRKVEHIRDLSAFVLAIEQRKKEKDITEEELNILIDIDDLQRNIVRLRSKKMAQDLIRTFFYK